MSLTYSGIILAGGASSRMGVDKRFLLLHGMPLLEWVIAQVRPLVDEVLVATVESAPLAHVPVRIVTDRYPGQGVLAGVHAGLSAARGDWALVVAGDMPALNPLLLRALLALAGASPADVIVPHWRGELEPLHALYRPQTCAPAAEAALQRGQRRIVAFYSTVQVQMMDEAAIRACDPEGASFLNVNTRADWERFLDQNATVQGASPNRSGCV